MRGTFVGISSTGHLCLSLDQYPGKVLPFDFLEAQRVLDENFVLIAIEDGLCQESDLKDGSKILIRVYNIFLTIQLPDYRWAGVGTISFVDKKEKSFRILLPEATKNRLPPNYLFKKEEFPRCTLPNYNIVITFFVYSKERENAWMEQQKEWGKTKKILTEAINETGKKTA